MSNTSAAAPEVRIAKSIGYRIIVKKVGKAVMLLLALAAVLYAIIAGTMTRYVFTDIGNFKLVSTNFPGGYGPAGSIVAIDPAGGHTNSVFSNLKTAVTPHKQVLLGEIIEGPFGEVDWAKYSIDRDSKEKLTNEYIMECLQGCTKPGSYALVKTDQIMGIPVMD